MQPEREPLIHGAGLNAGSTLLAQVPAFEADPDTMLSGPWEGLGPVWYWDHAGLNRYADENDPEMITRRINGGLNGYGTLRRNWLRLVSP